ncbi:MAG: phosphotransferase, partial [Myxococcota bacterium]
MSTWVPEITLDVDGIRDRLDREQPALRGLPITVLGEGWDSLAVRVGDDWVFRFTRRRLAATLMAREVAWMPWLAPRLPAGVPVPVPERVGGGDYPYAGHRWLPGVTGCAVGDDFRDRLAAPLGRFLRALHAVEPPPDGPEPFVGGPHPEPPPGDVLGRADHRRRGDRALERLGAVDG